VFNTLSWRAFRVAAAIPVGMHCRECDRLCYCMAAAVVCAVQEALLCRAGPDDSVVLAWLLLHDVQLSSAKD
jgi:hypothetical protein